MFHGLPFFPRPGVRFSASVYNAQIAARLIDR